MELKIFFSMGLLKWKFSSWKKKCLIYGFFFLLEVFLIERNRTQRCIYSFKLVFLVSSNKFLIQKNISIPMFIVALFIITKIWKQLKCSSVSTDEMNIVHLHNGILLGCKKVENFTICDSRDGPPESYAKWNKPVRERQIPYDFTHMWNLMSKLN